MHPLARSSIRSEGTSLKDLSRDKTELMIASIPSRTESIFIDEHLNSTPSSEKVKDHWKATQKRNTVSSRPRLEIAGNYATYFDNRQRKMIACDKLDNLKKRRRNLKLFIRLVRARQRYYEILELLRSMLKEEYRIHTTLSTGASSSLPVAIAWSHSPIHSPQNSATTGNYTPLSAHIMFYHTPHSRRIRLQQKTHEHKIRQLSLLISHRAPSLSRNNTPDIRSAGHDIFNPDISLLVPISFVLPTQASVDIVPIYLLHSRLFSSTAFKVILMKCRTSM